MKLDGKAVAEAWSTRRTSQSDEAISALAEGE